MSFATLECDRLAVTLRLTGERERGEALARELAAALEARLGGELARLGDAAGDGYLFIDRLEVEGAICGDWNLDILVRLTARRIADAIERAKSHGVAWRFADGGEYLAAYLVARAQDRASSEWCFREFQGLESLSSSNALRTAIVADVGRGIAALARLTPASAAQVLRAMNAVDAQRVVDSWSTHDANTNPPLEVLWRESALVQDESPSLWLEALLATERSSTGCAGRESLRMLREFVALRANPVAGFLEVDALQPRVALLAWLSSQGCDTRWVDSASDGLVTRIVAELAAAPRAGAPTSRQWSRFGGVILLWHTMSRLGWLNTWERSLGAERARVLALAVAAQAMSPANSTRVFHDAAWLELLELEGAPALLRRARVKLIEALGHIRARSERAEPAPVESCKLIRGALGGSLTRAARVLLGELGQGIPGLAASSPNYLRERVLDGDARWSRRGREVRVALGRASLDVLLVLAGRKSGEFTVPGGIHVTFAAEVD